MFTFQFFRIAYLLLITISGFRKFANYCQMVSECFHLESCSTVIIFHTTSQVSSSPAAFSVYSVGRTASHSHSIYIYFLIDLFGPDFMAPKAPSKQSARSRSRSRSRSCSPTRTVAFSAFSDIMNGQITQAFSILMNELLSPPIIVAAVPPSVSPGSAAAVSPTITDSSSPSTSEGEASGPKPR